MVFRQYQGFYNRRKCIGHHVNIFRPADGKTLATRRQSGKHWISALFISAIL